MKEQYLNNILLIFSSFIIFIALFGGYMWLTDKGVNKNDMSLVLGSIIYIVMMYYSLYVDKFFKKNSKKISVYIIFTTIILLTILTVVIIRMNNFFHFPDRLVVISICIFFIVHIQIYLFKSVINFIENNKSTRRKTRDK